MTGQELCDRLSGSLPGLKVIFISGFTEDEIFEKGSLAGNAVFLQKPFRLNDLLDRMQALLRA
jgi:DNA-binding response OmpR family regulator